MALTRFDPFTDVLTLRDAMNRLFEGSFVTPASLVTGGVVGMPVDIEESDESYTVWASLPGFSPEDVNISVMGDTVTIQAQHQAQQGDQKTYLLRERPLTAVSRTFTLPARVNADEAQASYQNGELILTLPKVEEVRPKRIQIGTNGHEQQLLSGQKAA